MVLVLRALGIGDLAAGVPALRGLRAAFPRARLALAAPAWLRPLAALTGAVDEVVPCDGLAPRPLPRADLAVNLHGRGPESHRLLAASAPGRLLGFATAGFDDGPVWTYEEHEVHRWCRMLEWYGIRCDAADLALRRPRAIREGHTVVHPGAKAAERRWPVDRYAAVAAALRERGHDVVVTGSPAERPLAAAVAAAAGLPARSVLAGGTDVGDLAALVAHARLVVSGDTGVAHLATGYGTPSVTLFGPVPPRLWGPPPDRPQHRPLWHGALLAVTVDEVLSAVDGVLDAVAAQ
ncbi:glycosyltransferase family 9 protein [Actinomycetes bacterium KLBMP 9797]